MSIHGRATLVFGAVMIVLGIVLVAETARAGGGSFGYVAGALFAGVGAGRVYLLRRR